MSQRAPRRKPIDWDDLRFVLAVADAGTLNGAASSLRVNRTTVLRRINAFERKHGVRLFERLKHGYTLTEAGSEILLAARDFENTIESIERKLAGKDSRTEGVVRVTTTDTLMASVLRTPLAAFRRQYPGITLDITTSNVFADLSKRDADVAIRPAANPPDFLIGRRVCTVAFAVYAAATSAEEEPEPDLAGAARWLAPNDTLAGTTVARWMSKELPSVQPEIRTDSLVSLRELCAAGAGVAALPCYLGDSDPRLVRVCGPVAEMATALWVLTHPDITRAARVKLFVEYIFAALVQQRALIEGQRPGV
jgi:DNA-binding transcriptional LysR family regulator